MTDLIEQAMQAMKDFGNYNLRITNANKWLVWMTFDKEWVVYEHRYRAKNSTVLYRGESLESALKVLLEDYQ